MQMMLRRTSALGTATSSLYVGEVCCIGLSGTALFREGSGLGAFRPPREAAESSMTDKTGPRNSSTDRVVRGNQSEGCHLSVGLRRQAPSAASTRRNTDLRARVPICTSSAFCEDALVWGNDVCRNFLTAAWQTTLRLSFLRTVSDRGMDPSSATKARVGSARDPAIYIRLLDPDGL